jgi:broad specificity phosphatase PhoE
MNALMNIVMKERNTVGVVCHAAVISSLACGLGLTDVSYDNCAILHLAYDFEKHMFIHVK